MLKEYCIFKEPYDNIQEEKMSTIQKITCNIMLHYYE